MIQSDSGMAPTTATSAAEPRTKRVTLRLRASLEYRPVAIALVSTLIEQVEGADRDFRNELITAFSEAFNNIVLHAYRDRADGMLDVSADIEPGKITLSLADEGHEVDFADVAPPDLTSLPESGMGVFMIHALVDDVQYRGGHPNVLLLMKQMNPASQGAR
jgi:serine/threonine-protein kinase RsbW